MGSAGFLSFALMIFGGAPFIGRFAAWIGGGRFVRILWEEVAGVSAHVKLCKRADALGLGRGPDAVPWQAVVGIEGDRIVVRNGTELG